MRGTLLLLIGCIFFAYAGAEERHTTQQHPQGKRMDRYTFGKEPIYKLRIKGQNSVVAVHINGVGVYEHGLGRAFALITVNDYIIHGDNNISVTLSDIKKLNPKAWGVVTLEVYYAKDGKQRHHTISRLVYDLGLKDKTGDSSRPGFYRFDDEKGMIPDTEGSLIVGKIIVKPETMYRRLKIDGIKATQSVRIPAPYPRWRFLDAPHIIESDYDYLSEEEYEKLKNTPKIQALYALDAKIRRALKNKNPQSIIGLFSERFEEISKAGYSDIASLKSGFLKLIISDINNPDKELVEYENPDDLYFVIEKNRKLAWIRPISIYDRKTGIYSIYNIRYRLNKRGEWVITR